MCQEITRYRLYRALDNATPAALYDKNLLSLKKNKCFRVSKVGKLAIIIIIIIITSMLVYHTLIMKVKKHTHTLKGKRLKTPAYVMSYMNL